MGRLELLVGFQQQGESVGMKRALVFSRFPFEQTVGIKLRIVTQTERRGSLVQFQLQLQQHKTTAVTGSKHTIHSRRAVCPAPKNTEETPL